MREAPGYVFAVSMAVAATLVAGFILATLITVSGVLADMNARLRAANLQLADRSAQQLDPMPGLPGMVVRPLRQGYSRDPQAYV